MQPPTINRMDEGEPIHDFRLVSLQMPDQVPANRHRNAVHLRQRFLNPILANVVQAGVVRRGDRFRPVRLGHGDDGDLLSMSPTRHRPRDPFAHLGDPIGEV